MAHDSWKRPADDGEAIVFALRHPLRRLILAACVAAVSSPKQLSHRFHEELPLVAYHTRALAFYGLIELVETASVRGSVQHFYRASDLGKRGLVLAEATGLVDGREGAAGGDEGGDG
jgi:hypothetical protein